MPGSSTPFSQDEEHAAAVAFAEAAREQTGSPDSPLHYLRFLRQAVAPAAAPPPIAAASGPAAPEQEPEPPETRGTGDIVSDGRSVGVKVGLGVGGDNGLGVGAAVGSGVVTTNTCLARPM